jgi:hypothetical protein
VCGTDDTFFHITVVPTLIVNIAGLKPKLPLLSFTIISICVEPETGVWVVGARVGVGASVGVGIGVGVCVAVVGATALALEVVAPLPQEASNSALTNTNIRPKQKVRTRCNMYLFIGFIFSAF